MTFLELQNYVGRAVDDKSFSYFTATDVKARLNSAQKEAQKRLISANDQYYTECVKTNTVANQKHYALPSDFIQIISLERVVQGSGDLIQTEKILPITPNQRFGSVTVSGTPECYYFEKNLLALVPVPSAIVEMHLNYSYLVVDMVNDSDVPDVPEQFHEYIGILAVRDCLFQDERSIAPIQYKLDHYEVLFKQIADQRHADGGRMIVMTDSYGGGGY